MSMIGQYLFERCQELSRLNKEYVARRARDAIEIDDVLTRMDTVAKHLVSTDEDLQVAVQLLEQCEDYELLTVDQYEQKYHDIENPAPLIRPFLEKYYAS